MSLRAMLIGAAVAAVCLAGCASNQDFRSADRADRLMAMAAEQARTVDSPAERLKRQLNIADMQADQGYLFAARKTLAQAAATLTEAGQKIPTQTRIAGWVSLSELSRKASDRESAATACERAVVELRAVQPEPDRCQYVRGVADEVRRLRGREAAAAVLNEAKPWVAAVADQAARRQAVAAVASDLFLCEDYEGGKAVLQIEPDPAWRADTLTQLAHEAVPLKSFGKMVNYELNFSK